MRNHAKASSAGSSARGGNRLGRIVRGAFATRGASCRADGSGAPSRLAPRFRGSARVLLACAIATVFALAVAAPSASASKGIVNTIGTPTGIGNDGAQFNTPRGLAVNKSGAGGVDAGTFYVVDSINNRLQVFNPDGTFAAAWGWDVIDANAETGFEICTVAADCKAGASGFGAGQFGGLGAQGVAIDPDTGVVFISDQTQRRINAFSATGTFEGGFGFGVADGTVAFQFCTTTCQTASAAGADAGRFGAQIGGLAVAGDGDLYVASKINRRVDVFTPAYSGDVVTGASFTRAFGWGVDTGAAAFQVCTAASTCQTAAAAGAGSGQFQTNSPTDVAFDAAGRLYALDAPTNKRIQLFDVTTSPASPTVVDPAFAAAAITAAFGTGNLYSLGSDPASNHIFLSGSNSASAPANQVRVAELDTTGAAVDTHGTDLTITSANGLAVAPPAAGGNIYVSSSQGGHRVFVLNELPAATLDDITTFGTTTATFSGTADPTGASVSCTFQYSTDGLTWNDHAEPDCASLNPSGGPQAVTEDVTGLEPGTLYRVRLRVVKAGGAGTAITTPKLFTTVPVAPTVNDTFATSVSATGATLNAKVNPKNQPTTYHFEYTDDADFQVNGFDNASSVPDPDGSAGSGNGDIVVSRSITGLDPATAYRFRVVIDNPNGTVEGPDEAFTTYAAAPVFGSCPNDEFRTGASAKLPDCRAYEQASPTDKNGQDVRGGPSIMAAADDGESVLYYSANGQPGGVGPQSAPFYLARRGGGEWSAVGVKPPLSFGDGVDILGWTPDLSSMFLSTRTTTGVGSFALYSRDSATAAFDQIGPAPGGADRYLGSSADGSISYFAGNPLRPLTVDAPLGKPSVYAWDRNSGEVRLAGLLPESACASEPCLPTGGSAVPSPYPVESRAVTATGNAYFNNPQNGQLYLRKDPFGSPSTLHVSASRRTVPAAPHPANFELATPDGQHAFFTSTAELTDASNTGPDEDPPAIGRADASDGANLNKAHVPLPDTTPSALEADADHLYWIEPDANSIGRSDLDGSDVEHDFITGLDNAQDLAVDDDHIYWTILGDRNSGGVFNGAIGRADLPADPEDPATNVDHACITGLGKPTGIDRGDGDFLYWLNTILATRVARADVNGSCAAADSGKNLTFMAGNFLNPGPLAIGDDFAYMKGLHAALTAYDLSTGATAAEISLPTIDDDESLSVAVDASHVYYGVAESGGIGRADLDLSNHDLDHNHPDAGLVTGLTAPVAVAVGAGSDSAHLYWATGVSAIGRGKALYRFDAEANGGTGELTDLAPDLTDVNGAEVQGVLGASDDGSSVYFVANADLDGAGPAVPGDCTGSILAGVGSADGDVSGECSIYLSRAGTIIFVARLDLGLLVDSSTGSKIPPERSDAGNWLPTQDELGTGIVARVSADGTTLVFRSRRSLTGYDNLGAECAEAAGATGFVAPGPCVQLYRYHLGDGLTCITCNPTGAPPRWHVMSAELRFGSGSPVPSAAALPRLVSRDGDRVIFETADRLVGADVNSAGACPPVEIGNLTFRSCIDVYQWEAEGTGSCRASSAEFVEATAGCLDLLSQGTGSYPSFLLDASADGDTAFILTRDKLVPQDGDSLIDAYAVRVGGGLASQHQFDTPGCQGDACQGDPTPPPPEPSSGSSVLSGPGNQGRDKRSSTRSAKKKATKCKKGKKGKKSRKCRKVRKHHGRAVNTTGRAGK